MSVIGLLALQGDVEMHRQALERLGATTRPVRRPAELADCAGLVIPGGESTTLSRLIDRADMRESLIEFAAASPVLATCAGMILLVARLEGEQEGHGVRPLGLLDCVVQRNGYGRQIDSFHGHVDLSSFDGEATPFPGVFIRAPRICAVGPRATVVGLCAGEAVALRQGKILALAFHPELTADPRIHKAFLALARGG